MKRLFAILIVLIVAVGTSAFTTIEKVEKVFYQRECSNWEATGNITVDWLTGQQVMQYRRLCCNGAPTMWCNWEYENRPLNE